MIKLLQMSWERLALYLPVILMGAIAFGTYWLVRSTPMLMPLEQTSPIRHEPDYFMHQFSVKTFDDAGRLNREVRGIEARHFPDTDTMEIDRVHIRSFNEAGRLTTATASRAVTSNDASEVQLIGNARVVSEAVVDKSGRLHPRLEFLGEFLHAFVDTERIQSHMPVELIRGQDRFTADTLDFDNRDRVMQLNGHVKGVFMPGQ